MNQFIIINTKDNVAVALDNLEEGFVVKLKDKQFSLLQPIPRGHKFAITALAAGDPVIKYGNSIGTVTANVKEGEWIHTHNIKTGLGELLDYQYSPLPFTKEPQDKQVFFNGYKRENGKVGVRNEIWIIPTVGCVNNVATTIAKKASSLISEGIDDVIAFPHPYGCSQMDEDQENTRKILADLINHPNAAGVLVLGLGCENSNIDILKNYIGDYNPDRVKFLVSQESDDEISDSLALIEELIQYGKTFKREPVPASELVIGLKCGGSDGLSGITANPTVGEFSDLLTSMGGSTILTEVPEMFGAETLLMNRAKNEEVFNQIVTLINDFKNYFKRHNQTIYENPSPGNKAGGISTLEDKSLGCTQKSGTSQIQGVLKYGEIIKTKGLNLLASPGNDLVASTALAASGAQIVLFTTGRGTPFASPVPTVKISTNTDLYNRKRNWIDFNCGTLVEGTSMEDLSQDLFDFVIKVASGELVKAEVAGYHDMAIFKEGVTL
ncbi:MAG TPA: altronate dehydratase family protein [Candidatus Dorea intestinavium]|nr:altronate dehydratase family protein [Candidatus Dorea intestinavium]